MCNIFRRIDNSRNAFLSSRIRVVDEWWVDAARWTMRRGLSAELALEITTYHSSTRFYSLLASLISPSHPSPICFTLVILCTITATITCSSSMQGSNKLRLFDRPANMNLPPPVACSSLEIRSKHATDLAIACIQGRFEDMHWKRRAKNRRLADILWGC